MGGEYKDCIKVMKALSDETRMKIFSILSKGELCACHILEDLSITQPTLSYHMKILCHAGLVKGRRNGIWINYSINEETLKDVKSFFDQISLNMDGEIKEGSSLNQEG